MRDQREYTTKDSLGFEVKKGDQVTIQFAGEVRTVSRDGVVVIKLPNGTITAWYPDHQQMRKLHDGGVKSTSE
jgi:hypothetical protein